MQHIKRQSEEDPHAGFHKPFHGNKGKLAPIDLILSGGLEDIVNLGSNVGQSLEGGLGRITPVTRASIAKGRDITKKIDEWKELGSEGLQDPWGNPDGTKQGTQVTNQPLSEPFILSISNSVLATLEPRPLPLISGSELQGRNEENEELRETNTVTKNKGEKRKK